LTARTRSGIVGASGTADEEAPMQRYTTLARPAVVLVMLLAAGGLVAVLLFLWRRRRRPDRDDDEPGEDIGFGPESAAVAAPEPVHLGGDIPPRPARPEAERWGDQSERRRLPPSEYRAAPDEPETEPEAAP
jgi:hypothetical protein